MRRAKGPVIRSGCSSLDGDAVSNLLVLVRSHEPAIDQVVRTTVWTVRHDASCRLTADPRQRRKLRLWGSIQVNGMICRRAAQAIPYTFCHRFGVVLKLRGRVSRGLAYLLRIRGLGRTRAAPREQEQKRGRY